MNDIYLRNLVMFYKSLRMRKKYFNLGLYDYYEKSNKKLRQIFIIIYIDYFLILLKFISTILIY